MLSRHRFTMKRNFVYLFDKINDGNFNRSLLILRFGILCFGQLLFQHTGTATMNGCFKPVFAERLHDKLTVQGKVGHAYRHGHHPEQDNGHQEKYRDMMEGLIQCRKYRREKAV